MKTKRDKVKYYFKYEWLSGHINIGNLTIYGRNAMHWGVTLWTKKYGYICFRLPFTCDGRWFPLYLYFSPNATPWASTFFIGKKEDKEEWARSRIRYTCFGHNFSMDEWNDEYEMTNREILRGINRMVGIYKFTYQNYQRNHPESD